MASTHFGQADGHLLDFSAVLEQETDHRWTMVFNPFVSVC
jgi:hypothetical protein